MAGALIASTLAFSPPSEAQTATCLGRTATIIGTSGADQIIGTNGPDVIVGGGGADSIFGLAGNDVICGGAGANEIFGGAGNDILQGGGVVDRMRGGPGNDIIRGGPGNDNIVAGDGFDRVFGDRGHDYLEGGNGVDKLNGGDGADSLVGGPGNDLLVGNAGNDRLFGNNEADKLIGGPGVDRLHGGNGPDVLQGGGGNDTLIGWTGNDSLYGQGGNDILQGGPDADTTFGGPGADQHQGGNGLDTCNDTGAGNTYAGCETNPNTNNNSNITTRIMPLGDSITAGVTADPAVPRIATDSYRPALWQSLQARGCNVDFVGSQVGTDTGPFANPNIDPNHEGYSGWTSQSLRFNVTAWAQAAQPDVVLLMAGTNDVFNWFPVGDSITHIVDIVARLRQVNPNITVLIGEVPPLSPPNNAGNPRPNGVPELNAALPNAVSLMNTSQSPVKLVQMFDELDINLHYQDGIHPDFRGEPIMAAQWEQALLPHIPSC